MGVTLGRPDPDIIVRGQTLPQMPLEQAANQQTRGQIKAEILAQRLPAIEALPADRQNAALRRALSQASDRANRRLRAQHRRHIQEMLAAK
jgi:hypothetical protein